MELPSDPPATSAALQGSRRLLCPEHGALDSICHEHCPTCSRRPYDLDDAEERSLLRNLRTVSHARRTNLARIMAVVPSVGVSLVIYAFSVHRFGGGWIHGVVLLVLLAAFVRPVDWLLGHTRSHYWRTIDEELNQQLEPGSTEQPVGVLSTTSQTAN